MASLTDGGVGVKVVFLLMMQEVLAEEATCYSAGSVAGAVVGTLLVTLALVGLAYLVWRMYWRSRRGKHLVLVTDPEGATDQYAFDNPCFKDGTPIGRTTMEKEPTKLDQKARWSPWNALVGTRTTDKRRALDDSFIGEPQVNLVALRSHDFTGLGFNICGNMRDGIFVKDVLHRGPASESGRITPGDRIDSIRISFRHMVFEDALTILSYASPYDVQLEVENASNSRPSTLIRTKRTSGSSIAPADRICHPFYRSQSIADLAQIGKASLKRMQQMGGIGKPPRGESHLDESGDYPTLKLSSSSGNDGKKENVKLEKTAPTSAIIKPERAKRVPSKSTPSPTGAEHREFPNHEEEPDKDTVNRFQKFGVRVLPDPNVSHGNSHHTDDITGTKQNKNGEFAVEHGIKRTPVEAEHRQNEQNSIIEKVGEGATAVVPSNNPHSGQRSSMPVTTSEVDGAGGKPRSISFYYDERGIDVGPVELQKSNPKQSSAGHYTDEGKQLGDVPGESNVKNLLTKGLQNLKEKLHHHEKKKNGSQNSELSGSTDQDVQDITPHLTEVIETEISRKNGKQREDKPEAWQDSHNETLPENSQEGRIPTEIPEEVHRAALAARSNRKSTCNLVMEIQTTHERKRTVSQEGPNGGSSSEGEESTTIGNMDNDSLGRTPKRPNKRKAPPPPPEESDEKSTLASQSPYLESDRDSEEGNLSSLSDKQRLKDNTTQQSHKKQSNPTTNIENIQTVEERVEISPTSRNITSFADLARQRNNNDFIHKEITNITIEGNPNKPLRTNLTTFGVSVAGNANMEGSLGIDKNITQDTKPQQQHLDYDIGVNVSSINSDSDSDLERLEGDDDSYDGIVKGRKTKKGGTTIELNSSHITIHHSPSSETVPIENESTRKAASLGDLSRIDSEQPMSILERAVSLDMADGGGTPHGCKKRKAPPPPPGEDYLGSMPDGDEGIAHRKEPRLDSAMDTFQRRRLKKSSDWGTLEEALMQTDTMASADLQAVKTPEHVGEEIPQLEGTVTVFKRNSSEHLSKPDEKNEVDNAAVSATFTHPGITRTDILNLDNAEYSVLERGVSEIENINQTENDSPQHQQKTILRITPEPVVEPTFNPNSSQVTIASSTFGNIPGHLDNSAPGERVNPPRHQADQSQIFTTKLGSAYGLGQSRINNPPSPQHSGSSSLIGLVSSTPISHSGEIYSMTAQNGNESVQSPIVTSSHAGISSVHVVSSTTHDITDPDSNILASSITDQFVTAVDSTTSTLAGEVLDDEDANWGHDSQPPELPTSPVPVLSHLSSFKPSPSMTYITEIQVVTTADSSSNNDPVVESTVEEQETSTEITSRPLKYKSDSSMSSDSITSEGDNKEAETAHEVVLPSNAAQKGNVTVTSIRNTVSRIPMRIATDRLQSALPSVHIASNSINHITNTEERRAKPARPPVPPRKSESSALSTITTEGVSNASRVHNRIPAAESIHIGSEPNSSSSKFISFSSLTPQITTSTENGASRNSTSFEQWVFLDEGSPHNGLEAVSNANDSATMPHSMVVSLPARTQSVTHIVLDTKQSNGNNGKP